MDAEIALASIDRLIRQQQLNFVILGAIPAVLVLYLLLSWLRTLRDDAAFAGQEQGRALLRTAIREAEMVLNRHAERPRLPIQDEGLLRIAAHVLMARRNLVQGEQRAEFAEDVAELEDSRLSPKQKMRVLERMRWCYQGVWGGAK